MNCTFYLNFKSQIVLILKKNVCLNCIWYLKWIQAIKLRLDKKKCDTQKSKSL